jgi:hypothetical protein
MQKGKAHYYSTIEAACSKSAEKNSCPTSLAPKLHLLHLVTRLLRQLNCRSSYPLKPYKQSNGIAPTIAFPNRVDGVGDRGMSKFSYFFFPFLRNQQAQSKKIANAGIKRISNGMEKSMT